MSGPTVGHKDLLLLQRAAASTCRGVFISLTSIPAMLDSTTHQRIAITQESPVVSIG
jgi:hypothetical protein